MPRICPRCNYVRRPTDDCPEWQCPSCQVAYNKAGATQESASYGRYAAPVAQPAAVSAGLIKWLVLAAVGAAALWWGKPAWQALQAGARTQVQAAPAEQPAITLYSTVWCGYCAAARNFFIANDIEYVELDVEKTTAGYEGHRRLGGVGVPLIVVGDDVIRGYGEGTMRAALGPWLKEPAGRR